MLQMDVIPTSLNIKFSTCVVSISDGDLCPFAGFDGQIQIRNQIIQTIETETRKVVESHTGNPSISFDVTLKGVPHIGHRKWTGDLIVIIPRYTFRLKTCMIVGFNLFVSESSMVQYSFQASEYEIVESRCQPIT